MEFEIINEKKIYEALHGMGEFNSDDHYIYYWGQKSLRRNGVAIMVNKGPKCSTWVQSQKQQNDLCSLPSKLSISQ